MMSDINIKIVLKKDPGKMQERLGIFNYAFLRKVLGWIKK